MRALLNEWEEFSVYTVFPEYKKDTYLGRFTLPMLLEIMGFQRILTILARGYLFRDGRDGYDRIDVARRADQCMYENKRLRKEKQRRMKESTKTKADG